MTDLFKHVANAGGDVWLLDPDHQAIAFVYPGNDYARAVGVPRVAGSDETAMLVLPLDHVEINEAGRICAPRVEALRARPAWQAVGESRARAAEAAREAAAAFDRWLDEKPGRRKLHDALVEPLRVAAARDRGFSPPKPHDPDRWRIAIIEALGPGPGLDIRYPAWDRAVREASTLYQSRNADHWVQALIESGVIRPPRRIEAC